MARGINKVTIIGNLGADPETRYMPSGGAVTNIRVATSESWKDKQTGEKQERTEWHTIVLFNRLAELAAQYLKKGAKVYIEGALRTEKWQDKTGADRYTTKIIANELQFLDSKGPSGAGATAFDDEFSQAQSVPASQKVPAMAGADEAFDDDIPF